MQDFHLTEKNMQWMCHCMGGDHRSIAQRRDMTRTDHKEVQVQTGDQNR